MISKDNNSHHDYWISKLLHHVFIRKISENKKKLKSQDTAVII